MTLTNAEENKHEKVNKITKAGDFSEYGTLVRVTNINVSTIRINGGEKSYHEVHTYNAIAVCRFKIIEFSKKIPLLAKIQLMQDEIESETTTLNQEKVSNLKELILQYSNLNNAFIKKDNLYFNDQNLVKICFVIASVLNIHVIDKLYLLQINCLNERIDEIILLLKQKIQENKVSHELQQKVENMMKKDTRTFVLKKKLSEINKELYGGDDEIDEIEKKIQNKQLPEEVLAVVKKELFRLKNSQPQQAETQIIRTYIETILDLPWNDK